MSKNNIKNLAKGMMCKYIMIFMYMLSLPFLIMDEIGIFFILNIVAFVLLIFVIAYDWKFILGEMKD